LAPGSTTDGISLLVCAVAEKMVPARATIKAAEAGVFISFNFRLIKRSSGGRKELFRPISLRQNETFAVIATSFLHDA
jgi:hypothetical protein